MKQSLKWAVRLAIWSWVGVWISKIFTSDLGASPALKLNHEMGQIALILLSANLGLGILMGFFYRPPKWVRFWLSERRFYGVSGFFILLIHVFFYLVNEGFESKAWLQMVTKKYLIFADLAFLLLFLLALTSNNWSMRRLGGKRWKKLHRFVYLVPLILFGHLLLIEKADLVKFGIWLSLLLLAQISRWLFHWSRSYGRVGNTDKE